MRLCRVYGGAFPDPVPLEVSLAEERNLILWLLTLREVLMPTSILRIDRTIAPFRDALDRKAAGDSKERMR